VLTAPDQATQNAQGEQAVADGAAAVVVVAIDGAEAGALVTAANAADVPVVAYDRLLKDVPLDYYVSFDGNAVGTMGGTAVLDAVGDDTAGDDTAGDDTAGGALVMLQSDPGDNNAGLFAAGAPPCSTGRSRSPTSATSPAGARRRPRSR